MEAPPPKHSHAHASSSSPLSSTTHVLEKCNVAEPSILSLPLDLLVHLFSVFANKPLLRAISLVCKRFRAAALRAITCFGERVPLTTLHLALRLLPRLTSLSLSNNQQQCLDLARRHGLRKLTMSAADF